MRYHWAIPEQLLQARQEILRIFLALSYPKVSYAEAFIKQLAVSGQNDDRHLGIQLTYFASYLHAVHVGHPIVEDNRLNRF